MFSNGFTLTINDSAKVLNTGGVDRYACTGVTEATAWTAVAAANVVRS